MTPHGDQDFIRTTSHYMNMSVQDYLAHLQHESNLRNIPSFIYLFVLGIMGLIGNSLILIVYSRKKKETATVVFIKSIAVVDLITNVLIIPATTYVNLNTWNFPLPSLCKAYIYLNIVTAVTPAINILAIAVTRYRKICHPFGWQVSTRQARAVTITVAIFSCLLCVPYTVVHGQQTIPTPNPAINGSECRIEDDYVHTRWPSIIIAVIILTFLLCCVPLTILYVLIGKQAWRHRHRATSFSKGKSFRVVNSPSGTNLQESDDQGYTAMSTESEMLDTEERDDSTQQRDDTTQQRDDTTQQREDCSEKGKDKNVTYGGAEFKAKNPTPLTSVFLSKAPRASIKLKSGDQKSVGRITRMLFVISAVYVLTNLTTLVLVFLRAAISETVATLSPAADAIFRLFYMSFLINCAVNPIIYNFYDRNFRKECFRMLSFSRK